jgi:dolichol-phosphate mannosyltransferase
LNYTIIISVYNEYESIPLLLKELYKYSKENQIIIINDGSSDKSFELLNKCTFIDYLQNNKNSGKGYSIKKGLYSAKNSKIIIFDGDLELFTPDISKLMILNKQENIYSVIGHRFKSLNAKISSFDYGNFIFTYFFNLMNGSCFKDVLCCAKSFYKEDIKVKNLKSDGFDFDVEILSYLLKNKKNNRIIDIPIRYKRRGIQEGKKLKISDGWTILKRIILCFKF